ncbi:hypothetical protein [Azotobacter vinelandii]|uniref:hypothetical protein n=1 Tax=Azotobacter vinelandii TaxID=354 RepID=UPI00266533F7|nr:hypothetical protein [Azotobacter vinelandii]WKN19861.1 hypothetical protein AVAEIV_002769 [Azotobacter vinelandii]
MPDSASSLFWAARLEQSPLGELMRGSAWLYPGVNLLHLLGLVLLLGAMTLLDLRLLGLARGLPLPPLSRYLTGLAVGGLLLQAVSGFCLFAADATALLGNGLMRIKLLLILAGLGNAWLFRRRHGGALASWDERAPLSGRLQAAASLSIWLAVMAAGRLLAYV